MKMKWKGILAVILFMGVNIATAGWADETKHSPTGERVVYSMKDILPLYRERAEQGEADAQLMMGQVYAMGDMVKADMAQAFSWFMKAAQQNHAEAQFRVAEMYLYGQGVDQNFSHAEKWAKKSAEQGYADGEYLLGLLYAEGKGMQEDWNAAVIWLCRAAEKGNRKAIDVLDTRTLTGDISPARGGEGVTDWCRCTSGRSGDC
ncbi:MAG: sel1 repeat family protein [Alistipes senegalensis]|nr:sel1 repeat family protein [Oxalobacter formigenes]MCM1280994.1 sel1 repeat family protein [Alistipes senegalensis]